MQTIYLDISNKSVTPILYTKQNDVGRKFLAVITESGVPRNISDSEYFSAWYSGDSGEGNYTLIGEKSAFSITKNKVEVEIITQMLLNGGNGLFSLVLHGSSGKQIGLWNIPYYVEELPGSESKEAEQYYTAFSENVKTSVDAAKRAEQAALSAGIALRNAAPVNLLDNSDFRNPVNQRKKTYYEGLGYAIDRWELENTGSALSVNDGYVHFLCNSGYSGLVHKLEHGDKLNGKQVTFAINVRQKIYTATFPIRNLPGGKALGDSGLTLYSLDTADILLRSFSVGEAIPIYWVALYEGEYTAETLPEYHPKGYGVELVECQRYYQQELTSTYTVAGVFDGAGCLDVVIPLKTTMRTIPTVNCIAYASGVAQGDNTIRLTVENTDSQTVSCSYQWKSTNFICPRYINGSYAWKKAIVTLRYTATADF